MNLTRWVGAVWICGTVVSFWWFSHRYAVPAPRVIGETMIDPSVAPQPNLESVGGLRMTGQGRVRILNFWSPGCGCSKFMEPHVRELTARFSGQVDWMTVIQSEHPSDIAAWTATKTSTPSVLDDGSVARAFGVRASPAVVVINSAGRVIYAGAYNISRFCQDGETAFGQKAIEAALQGQLPKVAQSPYYGCGVRAGD